MTIEVIVKSGYLKLEKVTPRLTFWHVNNCMRSPTHTYSQYLSIKIQLKYLSILVLFMGKYFVHLRAVAALATINTNQFA